MQKKAGYQVTEGYCIVYALDSTLRMCDGLNENGQICSDAFMLSPRLNN